MPQENENQGASQGGTPSGPQLSGNVLESFNRLLARNNQNENAVAQLLFDENHRHRETIRGLQTQLEDIRRRLPEEGQTIAPQADVDALGQWKELGDVKDVKSKLDRLQTLLRADEIRKVAKSAGYNPDVLVQLAGDVEFTSQQVQLEDGGTKESWSVKHGDTTTPLGTYAEQNWAAFLPVLQNNPEQTPGRPPTNSVRTQTPPAGPRKGSAGKTSPLDDFLANREKAYEEQKHRI